MDFPIPMRKRNRLQDYDYSRGGAYFITICSLHKKCIFGAVIGSEIEPRMCLNALGETVDAFIRKIPTYYPTVAVVRHCVMPNHIHLLLFFAPERRNPSLATVLNQFKGAVTKSVGQRIWQKGFYDHVIRSEGEFETIGSYIEHNAAKWRSDMYYEAEEP